MDGGTPAPKADWYPDPWRRFEYRFHNGERWTADVSSGGQRFVDVVGVAAPPGRSKRDAAATAAMVLGIVALSVSWMPYVFVAGTVCAVLALVFGITALRRRRLDARSFAVTGIVTGSAALVLAVLGVVLTRVVADALDRFEDPPPWDVEISTCEIGDSAVVVEGTLQNLGTRASDYRIVVRIPGRELVQSRRVVIELDDVRPGATEDFRDTHPIDGTARPASGEPTCTVVEVTGPLPFGVDPG